MKTQFNLKWAAIAATMVLGVVVVSGTSFAAPDDLDENPSAADFKTLDVDGNGKLTRAEASKDKLFTRSNFSSADADKDGTLTMTEYTEYKSHSQSKEVGRIVNDSVITTKVKADLLKDEGFNGLEISVETHKGVVLLSGFVDSKTQIARAEEIAKHVEGVKSVKNSLAVKS